MSNKKIHVIIDARGPLSIPNYLVDKIASEFLNVCNTQSFLDEYSAWEKTPEAQRLLKACGCL